MIESRVRLVSVDGKQFPDATDDETTEKKRALEDSNEIAQNNAYPRRYVQIPAGEHVLVFGLAKQIVPVKRDTHIAVMMLTGDASYTQKMYPGSAENVAFRITTLGDHTYTIYPSFDRPRGSGEIWKFKLRDSDSSRPVATEIGKTKSSTAGGTMLSPGDWAENEKNKMEAKK